MNFTIEQTEKAKNCKTLDEFKELTKAEGLDFSEEEAKAYFSATRTGELNDDDLDQVAGGKGWDVESGYTCSMNCPFCGAFIQYKSERLVNGDNSKNETSPNSCTCGASVRVSTFAREGRFEKNGESKSVPVSNFSEFDNRR